LTDVHHLEDKTDRSAQLYAAWSEQVRMFRTSVALYQEAVARRRHMATLSEARPRTMIVTQLRPAPVALPAPVELTPRQLEIAELIARGFTNQQIADELVVTRGTVANHVQHMLTRLALRSRTQIAVWFTERTPTGARRVAL